MRFINLIIVQLLFAHIIIAQPDNEIKKNKSTVIIIGGGMAGLSAAKHLKDNGINCLILEAQNKIGGRISTNRDLGFPIDEGASWIHGPINNPITSLAEKSGATTILTNDDNVIVYDTNGVAYHDEILDRKEKEFKNALKLVKRSGTFNKSFESVFNSIYEDESNDPLWKFMLSSYLEFDTGGDISRLSSTFFYDDKDYRGEDVFIKNGYDKLTSFLSDSLNINLNQRVVDINYTDEVITVKTANHIFLCDYVLVTVPLGVLKNNTISFTPDLPHKMTEGISRLEMGTVNKFVLVWDTIFWDKQIDYIGIAPYTKGKFNTFLNMYKTNQVNALMTFTFGKYSDLTESYSDDEIIKEIMS
ncbi:MAG: FAD-dependent oxidoreductase, partial [Flavobacteriales bacterium]|nr:FAD-dependent oxidoreductase [Flavobacteriales bacterium]